MDEFKDFEEKLNIKGIDNNVVQMEKKEVNSSLDHIQDIKEDYDKIRSDIVNDLEISALIIKKLMDEILSSESDNYLARKAEVFSNLLKTSIDLRTELMKLHASKKSLLEEEKVKSKEEVKGMTTAQVKELLSQDKKFGF